MSLPLKWEGASQGGRSRNLVSALSFPALLTVPHNTAGLRTLQTQEGRDVFFNDGKILEHNTLKIERVRLAFIWGTSVLLAASPGKCSWGAFPLW